MTRGMQIHWDEMAEIDATVREEIEARLERLIAQHDDVLTVRIAGHTTGHHRHGGREVHISAHAKGREIAASRSGPDLSGALHDALDAFEHELRKMRGRHDPREPSRPRGHPSAPRGETTE
jgi:ribosome-associated translation inhibitor RaiA